MSETNHKIYIWIRPSSLPGHPSYNPSTAVANKKRGAPGEGEKWGWLPGFYETKEEAAGTHFYTLIPLDDELEDTEYELKEDQTAKLLECGDLVMANAWEGLDFTKEGGIDVIQEEEYNYDSSSDDDSDNGRRRDKSKSNAMEKPIDVPPDNLIELTHLHEPSVVHALRYRFKCTHIDMSGIYTDTGPILLAVNPFKRDDGELYGPMAIEKYRERGERDWLENRGGNEKKELLGEEQEEVLGPHVYAVADRTFRTMMTKLHPLQTFESTNKRGSILRKSSSASREISNQSVLVSGESGAGKTVTTKLLMGYLSQLSQNPFDDQQSTRGSRRSTSRASFAATTSSEMSIERRVLESNPIMESFGNARTVRNDNSSRFGKYIEMNFIANKQSSSLGATLAGASIETYLLEKVRLVHQSPGERNYHIFYELFSLKYNDDEYDFLDIEDVAKVLDRFGLSEYEMDDFALVNASGTYDRRDGVTDSSTFSELCSAMSVMGFTQSEKTDVFAVTSALLHLRNLTFRKIGEVECTLEPSPHLNYVVDLLGITKEGLNDALCYYEIKVRSETHKKTLSVDQAEKGVEALIKATYGTMFGYLVGRINASISGDGGGACGGRSKKGGSVGEASIGILDIFGFESFQTNSFEQLCINYCNEALQQQFNRFVLRNEQEEYDREGIPWSYIEFPENQDVLDLIDFKGTGIINILHDQSRTPGASDKSFSILIYDRCSSHPRFEADAMMKGKNLFGIHHYAGLVEYGVDGFMEKNRDELPKESAVLLLSSSNEFVKIIATEMVQPAVQASPGKRPAQRPTVGMQFSAQLHELRRKIDETSPHYVRCLKPNYMLVPDVFDAALIADQLRCAGVIEAVRVSRLGYPQRYSHASFISRYKVLGMKALSKKKMADKKYNPAKALVHTITKQIIKASGNDDQTDVGIQVGKTKIFLRRKSYDILEKLRTEKMTSSAVRIQSFARRFIQMKRYQKACTSVLTLQCFIRRVQAKAIVMEMRFQHNSVVLQKTWRKYSVKKVFRAAKIIAKWSQTHHRGNMGRAKYNKLNRERRALMIQTCGRRYIAMRMYKRVLDSVLVIQCARRCYLSRVALKSRKARARDMNAVAQERDRLRADMIALKAELQKAKEDAKPQPQAPSEDILNKLKEKDEEIESLRSELDRISTEKESLESELVEAKEAISSIEIERDEALSKMNEVETLNAELQERINGMSDVAPDDVNKISDELKHVKSENERVLKEVEELISLNQALQDGSRQMTESFSNLDESMLLNAPRSPITAEVECALEEAVRKITELEEANKELKLANESLQNNQVNSSTEKYMVDNEITKKAPCAPTQTYIDAPALPLTSVYTTATTDNMTTDTEDEIAKLREENHVLQKQLELLRDNQGILPEIIGSDQEYEESVNPSDSEDEDESSGFDSANIPAKFMNRICHEVEEATEEVIIKTRAESEAKINKLQNEIAELRQELAQSKRVAKYDLDDLARANRSLRQELEEANEEVNRIYAALEDKCDEFDALNEDTERFAETFAAQHEEVRLLERKNRRLQEENTQLKALDAANTRRISDLQKASQGKTDSVSTPDNAGRLMWKELARMRKEIANMKSDHSTIPKNSAQNARGHGKRDVSCSDMSSDEEEWDDDELSDAS